MKNAEKADAAVVTCLHCAVVYTPILHENRPLTSEIIASVPLG